MGSPRPPCFPRAENVPNDLVWQSRPAPLSVTQARSSLATGRWAHAPSLLGAAERVVEAVRSAGLSIEQPALGVRFELAEVFAHL